MSTATEPAPMEVLPAVQAPFAIQPITYPVIEAEIKKWDAETRSLTIDGVADKAGYDVVHTARMRYKDARVAVEKRRKELKASAIEYGRLVDSAAETLTNLISPGEVRLHILEQHIDQEKARLKREADERRKAAINARASSLFALGCYLPFTELEAMSDEQFTARLEEATVAKRVADDKAAAAEAERQRLQAEEDARRKAEEERLAAERAALDKQRQEQEAKATAERAELQRQQDALEAQRKALADQEFARQREILLQRQLDEAAEQARVETEQRLAREQAERERVAVEEEAERKRLEEIRPAKEKIEAFALAVHDLDRSSLPEEPAWIKEEVASVLESAAGQIRAIIAEL